MGVLVNWAAPVSEASWTHSKIYRSTSEAGTYSLVATQALDPTNPDTTYFDENGGSNSWYKVAFWDSSTSTLSSYSDAFQVPSNVTYYTTPTRVAAKLQIRNSQNLSQFDAQTKPDIYEVIESIKEVEDRIDKETNHAWREKYSYVTTDSNDYETHHVQNRYEYLSGIPVYLNHRNIRQLDASEGDVFQLWNGSAWEDWLADRTEGRANDYWVDYSLGIVFLRTYIYWRRPYGVRFRYRYGEQTVPEDIKRAATFLVCADVARSDDRSVIMAETPNQVGLQTKIEQWETQAEEIIKARKELVVGVIQ